MASVQVKRLTFGTTLKLVGIGFSTPLLAFFILCGVLAMNGMQTVTVNGKPMTGSAGLIAALIMAPIFWLILSLLMSVTLFVGLWLFSLARPITVQFTSISANPE